MCSSFFFFLRNENRERKAKLWCVAYMFYFWPRVKMGCGGQHPGCLCGIKTSTFVVEPSVWVCSYFLSNCQFCHTGRKNDAPRSFSPIHWSTYLSFRDSNYCITINIIDCKKISHIFILVLYWHWLHYNVLIKLPLFSRLGISCFSVFFFNCN